MTFFNTRKEKRMFKWYLENIKGISLEEYDAMPYWLKMELLEEFEED